MAKQYDDPRMHTAEHVLNQSMVRLFGCARSFSSHINPGKSKCDYRFSRPLTGAEASLVQETVNMVLGRDLPVSEIRMPRFEAEKLVNLGKLPSSVTPETSIRIVRVGDYDICACIGEHVARTGEVGVFRLVSHEFKPTEDGASGVLRIRFTLE